jgi:hypothetical protein
MINQIIGRLLETEIEESAEEAVKSEPTASVEGIPYKEKLETLLNVIKK